MARLRSSSYAILPSILGIKKERKKIEMQSDLSDRMHEGSAAGLQGFRSSTMMILLPSIPPLCWHLLVTPPKTHPGRILA